MWSDKESSTDFLNFNETAESIKDLITEKELMPISVGIFGNWGAGKSTILELTKSSLENDNEEGKEYIQIHFDAWMFEGFDDAKAALLETIAYELLKEAEGDKGQLEKAREFAKRVDKIRLLGMLAEGGAALSGFPTFGISQKLIGWFGEDNEEPETQSDEGDFDIGDVKVTVDTIGKVAKSGKGVIKPKKKLSPPTEIRKFRSAYSSLLEAFNKPLIVYVDNLDRCSPINAISTLEAIRLFLFLPNTAFVIAADEDMIRLAVPHFHKGASQRHQTDYLDKLIQIPVHVPKPGVAEVRAYLMMLIASDRKVEIMEFEKIRSKLEESLRLSWQQDQITVDDLLADCEIDNKSELRGEFKVAEQLAPILAESSNINGNPRIVKRLLNQVRMRLKTAKRRGMQLDEKTITKLVIFERCMGTQATNKLYELIDKENGMPVVIDNMENIDEVIDPEKIPEEWKHDLGFLDKWSKLPPSFAGQDLTAAAYLSRQSIPMGAINSVMSGAAQKLLDGLSKQKNRLSEANSKLIELTSAEEFLSVMDGLIEKFKLVEDWLKMPVGFYGARMLALKDGKCRSVFLAYLKTVPDKAWKRPIVKELEGIK
ncbi:TPA: ATPase [Vibrio parahaemolyticus]|uniref:KAP family P-loop NTPase fold protein n=1 Tax=Vibrio alginolyticus TaxID=663 RepID=UPI0028F4496B|nr:P-loop NTPase fold protein [Vibrio alginolyticus]ELU1677456.1 ATPase [Vibrio parahaemolyticus]WMN50646.1 P-loop NTPase fold protein [Vibrio alginolyticus]HCE2859604.1 ATPase [Vibrio parahaemolyticus]HCG8979638.1 ATPase [Vibrio parahaemolyticus]HCG9836131.1 ATPase [Vibrio parahaemolyticus]